MPCPIERRAQVFPAAGHCEDAHVCSLSDCHSCSASTEQLLTHLPHYFKTRQSSPKHLSTQLGEFVLFLQLSFLSSPLHRFLYIPMINHYDLGI